MKEKTLSVSAIKEGTVIDHIRATTALPIIGLLRLSDQGGRVTVGLNLKSFSMGLKDLIKIEGLFLTASQADQIAIFSPSATINVIENYKVVKKFSVEMPKVVSGLLTCSNERCITNHEEVATLFSVEENNHRVILRCSYCEKKCLYD